jgi:hypothetical protein
MSELPPAEIRRHAALAAVVRSVRDLDLVRQDADGRSFGRAQELFLRWADRTRLMLAEQISEEEAQRFEDVTGIRTYNSADQYVEEYSNYLEALYRTLQNTPEQLLREPAAEPPPIIESNPEPAVAPATYFDRVQTGWKNNRLIVSLVIIFTVVVAMAAGVKQIRDAILDLVPTSRSVPNLKVEFGSPPFLLRTHFDTAVKMTKGSGGASVANAPHNLYMIAINDVTIWNRSQSRVSLRFEFKTKLTDGAKMPIVLAEDGTGKSLSRIPGVMPDGPDKWHYLEGPLNIDPANYVRGVLAFFYQQDDDEPSRIDFANGKLIITDQLSDKSKFYELTDAVWKP